jgi:hypothetical protein
MGVITATAKGNVTIGAIGDAGTGDKLTSLTASSTDGKVQLTGGLSVKDADGFTVSLTAATTIDDNGSGGATAIANTSGNIDLIDLNGTAVAVVDATLNTSGYLKSLDASGLTGGLTSTITNAESAASVSSTTSVSLGAKTSATVNSITFDGDVDTINVTGSIGKDTIAFSNTSLVDSGTWTLGSGTDTIDLTNLDGKVTAANGMVANFSSSSQTIGTATVSAGYIQEWDGTNALTNGVKIYATGADVVKGTNTADTIFAASTGMTVEGGLGADTITLGAGADTLNVTSGLTIDSVTGMTSGTDTIAISISALEAAGATITGETIDFVDAIGGAANSIAAGDTVSIAAIAGATNLDSVSGNIFNYTAGVVANAAALELALEGGGTGILTADGAIADNDGFFMFYDNGTNIVLAAVHIDAAVLDNGTVDSVDVADLISFTGVTADFVAGDFSFIA